MRTCLVCRFGLVPYETSLGLQDSLVEARKPGEIPDTLILLEHPPVLTLGKNAKASNILVSDERLKEEGIAIFRTERGGDVTYHGPGQVVGYPILNMKENGLTVKNYVWKLEEVAIKTLAGFGIVAARSGRGRGIFIGCDKIGAIGLRITGGVTMHGFALNVNVDLAPFDYIIPCGLSGIKATSMRKILRHEVDIARVQDVLLSHFAGEFRFALEAGKDLGALRI